MLGHRALDVMILVPSLFGFALFPAMARYGMESAAAAARLGERALRFMMVAVVPLTLFLTFTAGPLIRFFDKDGLFPDSVPVLMIVIWALPLQSANTIFGRLLITANRERAFVTIGLVAMLANVALNSLWIPRHSYFGASWATFISVGVSMLMHLRWLQPTEYRLPLVRALLGPVAATAAAWAGTVGILALAAPGWGAGWTQLPLQAWIPFLGTTGLMTVALRCRRAAPAGDPAGRPGAAAGAAAAGCGPRTLTAQIPQSSIKKILSQNRRWSKLSG